MLEWQKPRTVTSDSGLSSFPNSGFKMDKPKRTRTCSHCGNEFSYEIRQGADRKLCSKACSWASRKAAVEASLPKLDTCFAECCDAPATRVGIGLCEKHHARLRRIGDTKLPPLPEEIEQSAGYRLTLAPNHPLATSGQRSRVYTHRKVYYEAHGEGPFNCYHCGKYLTWETVHVDHLDDDPKNNTVSNLAASCPVCNTKRGQHKMVKAMQAKGQWIEYGALSLPISECAKLLGLQTNGLKHRLKRMPLHLALLTAPGPTSGKRDPARKLLPKKPKRVVATYTHDGLTLTLNQWASHLGLKAKYLDYRIRAYGVAQGIGEADPHKQRTMTADLSYRSSKD